MALGVYQAAWAVEPGPVPLSFSAYLYFVKAYHPVTKQAQLANEIAALEKRKANGTYDPMIHSDYTRKTLDGTLYYGYFDNYLKVPAWLGEFSAGYENNTGVYQNPTDYTPEGGLGYLGYTLPIGQGMLIDYRRAAMKQAHLTAQLGLVERQKTVNKLLFEAAIGYWDWYYAYQKYIALQKGQAIAQNNFNMVKSSISLGDASQLDSVEASLLVYERQADLQQAETDLLNARLLASNFMWDENGLPREMSDRLVPYPDSTQLNVLLALSPEFIEGALPCHPELNKVDLKLRALYIEKKLSRDYLLPNIDLTGKLLSTNAANLSQSLNSAYISNNNKIILTLNQPLFIRKERAKYKETNLKIQQTLWDQQWVKLETTNQIKAGQNKLTNYLRNSETQKKATANYVKVRDAEVVKYQAGDGNLLKINYYDSKAVEATLKSIKVGTDVYKAYCELYYKSGRMEELGE
jgi:outer membrane protein TolC